MITKFVIKDAHVPAGIVETMERRIHQRMDAYFKDEAEGDMDIGRSRLERVPEMHDPGIEIAGSDAHRHGKEDP